MIELRAVKGKTGRLIATLLQEKGVEVNAGDAPVTGIISYGVQVREDKIPVLNANAGKLNKFEELEALAKAGLKVPAHSKDRAKLGEVIALGRNYKHSKGKDIRQIASMRDPGRSDYYTRYINVHREYRVWAFRNKVLGIYEKKLRYPKKAKRNPGIAWNWQRGYAFEFYKGAPEKIGEMGIKAVAALGLDFGAVDILEDGNHVWYVLEVNTAPGVRDRRQGITYLTTKLARWCQNGFKKRKEVERVN